jgi:hypothetical protein
MLNYFINRQQISVTEVVFIGELLFKELNNKKDSISCSIHHSGLATNFNLGIICLTTG